MESRVTKIHTLLEKDYAGIMSALKLGPARLERRCEAQMICGVSRRSWSKPCLHHGFWLLGAV